MPDGAYAVAQDVASAVKVFRGEEWYDVTRGIPYFDQIFGKFSQSFFAAYASAEALTVPTTVQARSIITGISGRVTTGQVQIITDQGVTLNAAF